jgi:hypothetical protein
VAWTSQSYLHRSTEVDSVQVEAEDTHMDSRFKMSVPYLDERTDFSYVCYIVFAFSAFNYLILFCDV